MKPDRSFPLVLLCFLLSGFAALLYETVWTRQFAFVFGTSELAVATVLAGYMGGLALGAALAGRWAHRVRRPLRAYALLEAGIGLTALAVPAAISGSIQLCQLLFGGQPEPPREGGAAITLFYLATSFAILGVPTVMMGATLPLLARFAVRDESQIGRRIGVLYGINTFGAVLGTLCAAFVLLPTLGLARTVWVGVGVNLLVCAIAAPLARAAASAAPPSPPRARYAWERRDCVLPLILGSGVTSFTYEVLWFRLLAHLLGGSIYAFATMLASFLAGIALGSAAAARAARDAQRSARLFACAQGGIALFSLLAFLGVDRLKQLSHAIGATGGASDAGMALVAALALLPAALCIGATYPLAVRLVARGEADAGAASARVYAWNTVGAITGAVAAGFVVIPALGYEHTLGAAMALNLLLAGAALLLVPSARARLLLAPIGAALLLLAIAPPPRPWALLLQTSLLNPEKSTLEQVRYFAVGRSATVLLLDQPLGWRLRTNGLPEALILPAGVRAVTRPAPWLVGLPYLARPEARDMLVVGFGGGVHLEHTPPTLESIDVIELEPEVIEANRRLADLRERDPLADPRLRLSLNDARGALVLTDKRYDIAVSQPSHPWTAGASHLYTREFFELVREHLAPDGVFLQWIELGYLDETLVRSLVATMNEAFGFVRVYRPLQRSSVLLMGSDAPFDMPASAARAVARAPEAMAQLGVWGPEDVEAALALDTEGARAFASAAVASRDDFNLMQARSPRLLGRGLDAAQGDALFAPFEATAALLEAGDVRHVARRLLFQGHPERAARVAEAVTDPADALYLRAELAAARGEPETASAVLRELLAQHPDDHDARITLLRLAGERVLTEDPEIQALLDGLGEPAASVVRGWRFQAAGEWEALRALEPMLAAAAPHDTVFIDAQRLRIAWRARLGGAEEALKAMRCADSILALRNGAMDQLLRAEAAASAGRDRAALHSLRSAVAGAAQDRANGEWIARRSLSVLRALTLTGEDAALGAQLERAARRIAGRSRRSTP